MEYYTSRIARFSRGLAARDYSTFYLSASESVPDKDYLTPRTFHFLGPVYKHCSLAE